MSEVLIVAVFVGLTAIVYRLRAPFALHGFLYALRPEDAENQSLEGRWHYLVLTVATLIALGGALTWGACTLR